MNEFLLDPNVAYLALVLSTWLALLAVLAPGTGIFEVSAIFTLLAAGWGVYNLPVNWWALVLLALGGVGLLLALRGRGQALWLSLAIAGLVAGSAFLFQGESWWLPAVHPLLAVVVSVLSSGFFWFGGRKSLEAGKARPAHDLQTVIGELGEAKTDILDEGSVQLASELWSARSHESIPSGTQVRVVRREGFILTVEAIQDKETKHEHME